MPDEADLARILGVQFREPTRLTEALTHRSYLHDHPGTVGEANERLEFLGDAILQFVVAELLCDHFPHAPEGELTALRALLVSTTALADVAERIGLHRYIRASGGEGSLAGRGRPRILAGTIEAIIAAVHQDRGIRAARAVAMRLVRPRLDAAAREVHTANVKGRLQEQIQAETGETPRYVIVSRDGPVHAERFRVEVRAGVGDRDRVLGEGEGTGKRAAEQAAARDALARRVPSGTHGAPPAVAVSGTWAPDPFPLPDPSDRGGTRIRRLTGEPSDHPAVSRSTAMTGGGLHGPVWQATREQTSVTPDVSCRAEGGSVETSRVERHIASDTEGLHDGDIAPFVPPEAPISLPKRAARRRRPVDART